jgi:nitroimidazol reductase NimA-like FMN-containing flavoprotein (pyridoxamine 5'-phosphate oxidase superfamily)
MKTTASPKQPQTAQSSEQNTRIYEFLAHHPTGVLATVDEHNNPQATVIYYSVDTDFVVSFTTKAETRKHDTLSKNSRVQMVVYEPSLQVTVQITGRAERVENQGKAIEILRATHQAADDLSQSGIAPIDKLFAGEYVMYHIIPKTIRMAVFARPDPGGYDIYETIEF